MNRRQILYFLSSITKNIEKIGDRNIEAKITLRVMRNEFIALLMEERHE